MKWLQYNVGGTLSFLDLPERCDASPTFTVRSPSGGSLLTGTGTRESVDTTLNGATSADAVSLIVTSASNITLGRRYLVGGHPDTGGEWVTVKSISGTTVTLLRPMLLGHATGVGFQSTRVDCIVTAAACSAIWRHHRLDLSYVVSAATRPVETMGFDVIRYSLTSSLNLETLRNSDPLFVKRLPAGIWLPALISDTWDEITDVIAAQKDPGALVGSLDLTRAHAYRCRAKMYETAGKDFAPERDQMYTQADRVLEATLASHPFDDDQDSVIEPNEKFTRTIRVSRG